MTEAEAIERLRNELRMQKARIRGWIEDKRCNLATSMDSFLDATDELDEALKATAEHDFFARRALSRTRSLEDAA
ncbi:hypothetical protein CN138_08990 [Sinorhizobium meliloti]|uniref:hypothetical protein n=1 Tax=Rhizobium meliloti TaxID=382 RepID=UPI000FD49AB1|nr:hypothetical protein [Sinorhizobium meliloti]RVL48455.1 hypothetical protein CN145_23110 [Sinorhizobium meliloti]RVL72389.1 hypothetical protein CN138_08990 [Sinorhizobium meliloti]